MSSDIFFWVICVASVLLVGIAKGGFSGLGVLAVPLMALVMPPLQAAGILLPILVIMDWTGIAAYRGKWDREILKIVLPGAMIGLVLGYIFADTVSDALVKILVGLIAIAFPIQAVLTSKSATAPHTSPNRRIGWLAGAVSGFTSFVAHAGGPPFQAYVLGQKPDKIIYAGTAVLFFAVVNAAKILPYAMLGQFERSNIMVALVLVPVAPVGVLLGAYLIRRINAKVFYRVMYVLIFLVGTKLIYDGIQGL